MSEYEIDSQLKELLDLLRPVPERNSDAMYRSRTKFNAELEMFFPDGVTYRRGAVRVEAPQPAPARVAVATWPRQAPARVAARPKPWYYRPVFAYLALTLVILVAMFSGGYVTVLAAGSALPGDALYPLKLNVEQASVSLTSDPARQSELYLEFAQNRLEEMSDLAALGQYDYVEPLANQFNINVASAIRLARQMANRDPERAMWLEGKALQTFGQLKPTVDVLISNAPKPLQPALQAAIERAAQANPPVDNANGNNGGGNPGTGNSNEKNKSNANSNSNESPGMTNNGNGNDNSNANPNANPNSSKNKDKNNNGQDDDKNNNGKNDDKNNNGKNDDKEEKP